MENENGQDQQVQQPEARSEAQHEEGQVTEQTVGEAQAESPVAE